MKIDYKKLIDDIIDGKHQSLGYFMIGYMIDEESQLLMICETDGEFNNTDNYICSFDYINDVITYYRKVDSELNSYLSYEIFWSITKKIKEKKYYLS